MFDSAKQKIERADHHIRDLERQFATFVRGKPHSFRIQPDIPTGALSVGIHFRKEIPRHFAAIIGDAIHNLRTALDHGVWEMVGIDGGTQDRYLQFPTGDTRISFEASCKGIKTSGQWVKDAIMAQEAFIGGAGMDLYHLSQLDNSDKHIEITPVLRATEHPAFHIVNASDGRILKTIERNTFAPAASGTTVATIAQLQVGLGVELEDNAKCAPTIFFIHPGGIIGSPAVATLRRYSAHVSRTIADLEKVVP